MGTRDRRFQHEEKVGVEYVSAKPDFGDANGFMDPLMEGFLRIFDKFVLPEAMSLESTKTRSPVYYQSLNRACDEVVHDLRVLGSLRGLVKLMNSARAFCEAIIKEDSLSEGQPSYIALNSGFSGAVMANSKYEYVKDFEVQDNLMPHTWIVIRIDGRGFTKFSQAHQFQKPNDKDALLLMNASAKAVVEDLADIVFAYGVSDEYSFVLRKTSTLYQRRASKLISVICSLFASSYVMKWCKYFPNTKLQYAPAFDGRAVCYPSDEILRDYLSWRQVDCHINNQYNTCFWNIVGVGKSTAEAQNILKGTTADVKNNLLFDTFKINYNDLPQIFRKGSIIYRKKMEKVVKVEDGQEIKRLKSCVVVEHEDIIRDSFWRSNPHILSGK